MKRKEKGIDKKSDWYIFILNRFEMSVMDVLMSIIVRLPYTSYLEIGIRKMKRLLVILSYLSIAFIKPAQAQDGRSIVKKADEKMRGTTSQAEMIIKIVRPSWSREMTIKTWSKGNNYSMVLLLTPVKDKGISFLKRKNEVWNWMPALERTIKLPPSMMSQSWMGTDFTNDDLVKESSIVEDYIHNIAGDTVINNRDCYLIQMMPKPEAAVVWGKLIKCIDKKDYLELHTRFYDEDGKLINIMNAFDVKQMGGRLIPTHFEMIPMEKKGHKTEMIYKQVTYNLPIDDSFFTPEKMKTFS